MTYVIGIDLGTTNTVLSFALIENKDIEIFDIEQICAANQIEKKPILPSFIYFPLEEELKAKVVALPWNAQHKVCTGFFAKERGKEVANRLVHSAKSWLCHDGVNRHDKILPFDDQAPKRISPIEAIQEILDHLKKSWNQAFKNFVFEKQKILITVPASFDPAAKELVLEAAKNANYPEIVLLEEPQAAFYSWLYVHEKDWRKSIAVNDAILVIDIGGGTTDFTLIGVNEENGDLSLKRIAVGDHLLLGGDNLDLALAQFAKEKLENEGYSMDDWQFQHLTHACREAKENFLSEKPSKEISITVPGRGSKLIGGSIKTSLKQEEVSKLIVDGFFPLVDNTEEIETDSQGIMQIGLPYAHDPRVTAQLATFLRKANCHPTHVLFNGGTLKSHAISQRLLQQLQQWAKKENKPLTQQLSDADFDYAVSRGATYYGLVREGKGIRIKAGTSHSYFIGVQAARPAIPGFPTPIQAVCIAPFGMEEGTEATLENQEFSLVLGQQVTFRFFGRPTEKLSDGSQAQVGTVIGKWAQELKEYKPVKVVLEKQNQEGRTVKVKLKSKVTETGIMELWCYANDGREWKLEFNLRNSEEMINA